MKGGLQWLLVGLALGSVFHWPKPALAQDRSGIASKSGAGEAEACFPACRSGFACDQGRCVSLCNPPCPPDQSCMDGSYCAPEPVAGVYEPPPPPPAERKTFADRIHSGLGFHMGFGGTVERSADTRLRADLDTTYGANLRSDIPVARYLLLGPLFQFAAYRADVSPKPNRDYTVDIDLYVRGRLPLELDKIGLQLWAGVPVGLTLSFLGATTAENGGAATSKLSGFGVGWNIGFLLGGALHFSKTFGMFAEVGWVQHRMSHDFENRDGDTSFAFSQTAVNLGFMFYGK